LSLGFLVFVCWEGGLAAFQCLEMGKDLRPYRWDGTRFSLQELFTDTYLSLRYF